ncbi:hypothetical protein [Nostoc sp.]
MMSAKPVQPGYFDSATKNNYVECFWQFGIQNFSVAVLIEISAGLQGN